MMKPAQVSLSTPEKNDSIFQWYNNIMENESKYGTLFEPVITEIQIRLRISQLAEKMAAELQGKDILALSILKGAFMFTADLLRKLYDLGMNPDLDFIRAVSYGRSTESSDKIVLEVDKSIEIKGRSVLIIDDIVDTGRTLFHIKERLISLGADEVMSCVLLDKPSRRKVEFHPDWVGFEIPDLFVVGYGMDYAERYRYLPFITTVDRT
ncbi:MAG: hypoxanthine phosphoribosyltransferase [Candidatus Hatepunaea meridiana]|nr:hypoxanthine phosphoribosyltransferase [Candidatus Hatepunaea meridiana]